MKMKLRKSILLAAVALLSLTSCLKDQADVFTEPSSQRMQDFLENARKELQSSEKGWVLSYVPGKEYATCYMGVVFTAQQVTAYSQNAPEKAVVSSYKLTTDDGAVLSFDTYNSVLHYYATADGAHYQARGGDFEFVIKSVTKNRIVLRGKRSGNYCYLDRLTGEETISEYLAKMAAAERKLDIVSFTGEITGGLVEGFLDGSSHTFSIGRKGAEASEIVSARYMVVPGGIHINEPVTFQGVTFEDFAYDSEAGTFTGSGITFQKVIPEGYVPYSQFLGKWTFYWYGGEESFQVELVAKDEGATFSMKGFSTYFEPVIGYNAARGYITWLNQVVGQSGGINVVLAGWAYPAATSLWPYVDEGVGMDGIAEDNTVAALNVVWTDNGAWGDNKVQSWVLWGLDAGGNSAGSFSGWTTATGSYQVPGPFNMVKIVE